MIDYIYSMIVIILHPVFPHLIGCNGVQNPISLQERGVPANSVITIRAKSKWTTNEDFTWYFTSTLLLSVSYKHSHSK